MSKKLDKALHLQPFPEELKNKLKSNAALKGMTLKGLIVKIFTDHLEREAVS